MPRQTSPAAQDYLKAIYVLGSEGTDDPRAVSTSAVAQHLDVSAASATNMLKRLDSMGLVTYTAYRGAQLTDAGTKVALEVIRHHRLLETYLAEALGVPWDEVHAEAEVLEHVISEDLEDRMAARLGNPTSDPHGHPIPAKDGSLPQAPVRRLWDVPPGERASVERVPDDRAQVLRYLAEVGITPGVVLEVVRRGPVGGPLFVRVEAENGEQQGVEAISRELAEAVWVS